MRMITFSILSILLVGTLLIYDPVAADEYSQTTIIWKSEYEGDLFCQVPYGPGHDKAGFPINGEISNVGYSDGNGNYFISALALPRNYTLIIEAGIKITFTEYYSDNFFIWGNIKAMGTKEKPIIFTSDTGKEETQPYESWSGIDIQMTEENSEPEFYHCYIDHASITSDRGIIIENTFVNNSRGIGVSGENKWKAIIRECGVTSHSDISGGMSGFHISDCSEIELTDNTLSGNYSHIIAFGKEIICEGNTLTDNDGIHLGSTGEDESIVRYNKLEDSILSITGIFTVEDNYFSSPNCSYALDIATNWNSTINNNTIIGNVSLWGTAQRRPVDLRYNYWGTVDSEKINKSIQRNPRDDIIHQYEYEPYLDEDMKIFVYQPPEDDEDPDGILIIILISIGVIFLILVILILFFILIRMRQRKNPFVEEEIVPVIEIG